MVYKTSECPVPPHPGPAQGVPRSGIHLPAPAMCCCLTFLGRRQSPDKGLSVYDQRRGPSRGGDISEMWQRFSQA